MFCPKCSTRQSSENIRYCTKCGFALEDIAEAIVNNGRIPRKNEGSDKALKNKVVKGVAAMTLGGIFFIFSLIIGTPEPSLFVQFNLLVGVLAYLGGIGFISYHFLSKSKNADLRDGPALMVQSEERLTLNPSTQEPAAAFVPASQSPAIDPEQAPDTVTDQTTRRLEMDDKPPPKS